MQLSQSAGLGVSQSYFDFPVPGKIGTGPEPAFDAVAARVEATLELGASSMIMSSSSSSSF